MSNPAMWFFAINHQIFDGDVEGCSGLKQEAERNLKLFSIKQHLKMWLDALEGKVPLHLVQDAARHKDPRAAKHE